MADFNTDNTEGYTVFDNRVGFRIGVDLRGLSEADAARELLTEGDGYIHEIRRDDAGDGWTLWTSMASSASPAGGRMAKTGAYSLLADEEAATAEIYAEVVRRCLRGANWGGRLSVMTDAEYNAVAVAVEVEDAA